MDIVWVPDTDNPGRAICGPFVLLGLSGSDPPVFMMESGDNSDMNGYGYFANEDGTIYREVMQNYMDLEYYPGPYKPKEKILLKVSEFLKEKIDIEELLGAYQLQTE